MKSLSKSKPAQIETTMRHEDFVIFDAMPIGRPVTVNDMMHRANKSGKYTKEQIRQALIRIGRSSRVKTERIEMKGLSLTSYERTA